MGIASKLKKSEDALASLTYEGIVILGSLFTFYTLYTKLEDVEYGVLVGVAGLSGTISLAMVSWGQPWLLEAVMKLGRPMDECIRRVVRLSIIATALSVLLTVALATFLVPKSSTLVAVGAGLVDGIANGLVFLFVGVVQLRSTYVRAIITRAAMAMVRPVVVLVLLVADQISIVNYLVGVGAVLLVALVPILRSLRTRAEPDGSVTTDISDRSVVSEGAQYGLLSLSWALQEDFDKTLLNTYGFAAEAGPYAAGYKFVQMATLPIKALVSASHHRFLRPDESGRTHLNRAIRLTAMSVAYAAAAAGALLLAMWYLADHGSAKLAAAAEPARLLAGLIVLRALVWYPFNALLSFSMRRVRVLILVGTSLLNLGLNLVLIPRFSWKGAIWSTYITEIAFGLASWIAIVLAVRRGENDDRQRAALLRAREVVYQTRRERLSGPDTSSSSERDKP